MIFSVDFEDLGREGETRPAAPAPSAAEAKCLTAEGAHDASAADGVG